MTKKSSRDIEFAIRLAIDALRREMEAHKSTFPIELGETKANRQNLPKNNLPEKHHRDVERAIAILKAIKAGVYGGEE